MKVTYLARLLDVSIGTIRRWVRDDVYGAFLSPSASPAKGNTRIMTPHDQRVLFYVSQMREIGASQDAILERLRRLQDDNWRDLPPIPAEWDGSGNTLPVDVAANRASEMVQSAVLQKEVQHLREALQLAESKVEELETQIQANASQHAETIQQKEELLQRTHQLELTLSESRGEAAQLKAELKAYGMTYSLGGNRPVSPLWIVLVTALGVAILMIIMIVVVVLLT